MSIFRCESVPRPARLVVWVVSILAHAAAAQGADLEGRVTRVGLFAGATPLIRAGVWSFVEVELRARAAKPFEGQLRVEQIDRDGDVATSVLPVALAPGGEWRPYELYFVPYDQQEASNLRVRLYDAAGRLTSVLDETGVAVRALSANKNLVEISPDEYLIVDLTTPRRLPHVSWLDCTRLRATNRQNARHVRPMSPRELPRRAQGLECVDAIVWDDADPSGLDDQQLEALASWVRGGGRLLVSGGRNWQGLTNSRLDDLLPVQITGLTQAREAQEFLDLVPGEAYRAILDSQHHKRGLSRCVMTPRTGALSMPTEPLMPPIVYRRLIGRGCLTFVGAPLMQLMPPPARVESMEDTALEASELEEGFLQVGCEKVVASRLLNLPPVEEEESSSAQFRFLDVLRDDL